MRARSNYAGGRGEQCARASLTLAYEKPHSKARSRIIYRLEFNARGIHLAARALSPMMYLHGPETSFAPTPHHPRLANSSSVGAESEIRVERTDVLESE